MGGGGPKGKPQSRSTAMAAVFLVRWDVAVVLSVALVRIMRGIRDDFPRKATKKS
jgi:hypothetical protein